jgi:hypothetical protein
MTFRITVLDTSEVTGALVDLIAQFPAVDDLGARVVSNAPVNEDGGQCPWVGVYQTRQEFVLRTLGAGPGFRMHRVSLAVVLTESSLLTGRDCERKLERLLAAVLSAILSDPSLRGTLLVTQDPFSITYSNFRDEGGAYFKQAVIQFTAESPVTVTTA